MLAELVRGSRRGPCQCQCRLHRSQGQVLIVLHGLAGKLLFSPACLVDWIVELGESVGVYQLKTMVSRIVLKTLGGCTIHGVIADPSPARHKSDELCSSGLTSMPRRQQQRTDN